MKKNSFFATLLLLVVFNLSNAQTLLTESFDNALNWTVAHPAGTSENAGWTRVTSGSSPTTTPFSGAGMAMFNGYSISAANTYSLTSPAINFDGAAYRVVFKMYRDPGYENNADKIEVFINTTASSAGGTLLGTVNRSTLLAPAVSSEGWYSYAFNIPGTPTGARYISFLATSAYGNNMFIDQISVEAQPTVAPNCATSVTASIANCGNFPTNISWEGSDDATGYRLTIGTTSGGTDIVNNEDLGNNMSYILDGMAGTMYYYTITPYNAVGSAQGCEELTFTTATAQCYCASIPETVDNEGITEVVLGTTVFENEDVTYTDNSDAPVTVARGLTTNLQISFETGYSYYTYVWIDLNDDYDFDDAGELMIATESEDEDETTLNASFLLPANTPLGMHSMRIVTADSLEEADPCYSDYWGATIDFKINVIEANCAPAVATAEIIADCDENSYFVEVDVTNLGSGTPVLTDGTTDYPITETGIVTAGPYDNGTATTLTILHGEDDVCDVSLGSFNYMCPPANDECSNAIALTVTGTYTEGTIGYTTDATGDEDYDGECGGYEGGDVWYTVVVPASGSISIETGYAASETDGNFDSVLTAYTGTCGDLTLIDCNDDGAGTGFSLLELTDLTPGETIYLRVYEYNNDEPGDNFTISAFDASLSNADFTSSSLKVYPNPVSGMLKVSNAANISKIVVYNVLGQKVNSVDTNATDAQIDMSALTQGTYIVQITSGNSVETVKVIKQ